MNNVQPLFPRKISWILFPIVLCMIYTIVFHKMPVWELIVALFSVLAYAITASYYIVKAKKFNVLIYLWIVVIAGIVTFIINKYVI